MAVNQLIRNSLSARLLLWIVTIATIMFVAVLWIMLWFARQALEEEATQKALSTLDSASLFLDNELAKIEVAVRNLQWFVERRLDNPDAMIELSRQMLESNSSFEGCNIAFRPYYYPDKGRNFMVYNQRMGRNIVGTDNYSNRNFDEEKWFAHALQTGTAEWADPSDVSQYESFPITSFNVPFYAPSDKERKSPVGVISVDISLERLSNYIENSRPFSNIYCSVLNRQGSFIIHPDTTMLAPSSLKSLLDMFPSDEGRQLAEAMTNGEYGRSVLELDGTEYYVFYRPFRDFGWSISIFCPLDSIDGSYHQLLRLGVIVTVVGLLSLLVLSLILIVFQLGPLYRLDKSARRLAKGKFDVTIADTSRQDEIGHLQRAFRTMQQSLAGYLEKIALQHKQIEEHGEQLRAVYEHLTEVETAKSAFMKSATDQLSPPVTEIGHIVSLIGQEHARLSHSEVVRLTQALDVQTQMVVDLFDKMLKVANEQSS